MVGKEHSQEKGEHYRQGSQESTNGAPKGEDM